MRRSLGIFGLLCAWEVASYFVNSKMFPPISAVIPSFFDLVITGKITPHVFASLTNIGAGYFLAVIAGTAVGILIAESHFAEVVLMPIIDAMRPIAALTMFPLIITVLGLGLKSKAFVIFWTAWPAITLNTIEGLRSVDGQVLEAGLLDGCNEKQLLYHIKLPLSVSMLMTGFRIGLSGGWISLVSAEMLGASAGLGYAILHYSQTFRFPPMYAIIITIALIGLGMNVLLALLQRYLERVIGGKHVDSPFIRFHDRASSFGLDTFRIGGSAS